MGLMMGEIEEIASVLRERYGHGEVVGISPDEVEEVRVRQGVEELPLEYRRFLALMGRRAGGMLVGTDIFYPAILPLKDSLDDFPVVRDLISSVPGSLVLGMHQGYQVYVVTDVGSSDPKVLMYEEDEDAPVSEWDSFTDFLRSEMAQLD
ncbi:Uncharacterised protein [Amycolatopsis camponoti]|uniref:Knr4/Smi1-like domain-containing protein n=2 Tax=Amycolatopsis camponoti TaxID=2606593 RepID=A0A6I8LH77_9PSEU|nr:SMI1/KNR4 family protein [Amycolatopsis camponoti]VVJ15377.1 Uncharacterised protein [Amycolatopsis camponoti]